MDPVVCIRLKHPSNRFQPGDVLTCDYRVDAESPTQVQSIEASVLWYTEGKGEEDLGVQYFERHVPSEVENGDLRGNWQFSTRLPFSPQTYQGVIVKLRWCIRVRVFFRRGRNVLAELPFQLGDVPASQRITSSPEADDDEQP
jgi:hypothetical protein